MRWTSPTIASSGSQEPDARRLIAEYEEALTAALAETDQIRAHGPLIVPTACSIGSFASLERDRPDARRQFIGPTSITTGRT
jgi:hypothetical protein